MSFLTFIKAGIELYRQSQPFPTWEDAASDLVWLNRTAPATADLIAAAVSLIPSQQAGLVFAGEPVTAATVTAWAAVAREAGDLTAEELVIVGKIDWAALIKFFIENILPFILPLILKQRADPL